MNSRWSKQFTSSGFEKKPRRISVVKNISPQFTLKDTKTNNWKNRHGRHYGGNTYVSLMVENKKGSTKGHNHAHDGYE